MKRRLPRLDIIILLLATLWLFAILAAPQEQSLGTIIRWVFAHASLTQVSMLLFLAAAALAVIYLIGRDKFYVWAETTGWVALGLWLTGFLLSTIPAKFSWSVWIDFNEPRTQMTLRIIAAGAGFILLTRWVDSRRFTAIAQIILSVLVLFLTRSTNIVRHPLNPIGQASDSAIPLSYSIIFLLALTFSALLIVYIVQRRTMS